MKLSEEHTLAAFQKQLSKVKRERSVGKKVVCLLMAWLFALAVLDIPALAKTKEERDRVRTEKVREAILKLGTGEESAVRLALKDKSYREGYVAEIRDEAFVVANPVADSRTEVGYAEVMQLKGANPRTGIEISVPKEMPKALRVTARVATFGVAGRRKTDTEGNGFLSTPAIVILAVLAVGLILIGVELKKS
jgi:hypothetical protein